MSAIYRLMWRADYSEDWVVDHQGKRHYDKLSDAKLAIGARERAQRYYKNPAKYKIQASPVDWDDVD